jgi:hypothetical protein
VGEHLKRLGLIFSPQLTALYIMSISMRASENIIVPDMFRVEAEFGFVVPVLLELSVAEASASEFEVDELLRLEAPVAATFAAS